MAHLTCVEHGRRSVVVEVPKVNPRQQRTDLKILHRGDRDVCSGTDLRHGKVEVGKITVYFGLITEYKKSLGSNWTESSEQPVRKRKAHRRR